MFISCFCKYSFDKIFWEQESSVDNKIYFITYWIKLIDSQTSTWTKMLGYQIFQCSTSRKQHTYQWVNWLWWSPVVLFVFCPVRLDVARASRPKITTASSCVNTDILVLDNRSNVLLGIFMPPPREIYFDQRRKNMVSELLVWINASAIIIHNNVMILRLCEFEKILWWQTFGLFCSF